VTANKALLAERGDGLFELAAAQGCEIGFEASVCGGIPVIRALRDGLVGNRVAYLLGILNGTSNYILTRMSEEGIPFAEALSDAQRAGFAEADPTFDVEGFDAAHKLCILARLAFGCTLSMSDIARGGISRIEPIDIAFARELGYRIKLLAVAKDENGLIEARVEPAMLPMAHVMSNVNGVFNALYVVGDRVGPTLYYGKGAGGDPTGSAVVSDIIDMAGYEGVCFVALIGAIAAGGAATITVNQGDDPALADTAVVDGSEVAYTDADENLVAIIDIRQPTDRYLNVDVTRGAGGNTTIDGILAIQYRARDLPVTQGATVQDTVVLVSPDEV
jgi:hypothetical protein